MIYTTSEENSEESTVCGRFLMVKVRKSPVEIKFEILEYLYYNSGSHPRTHIWRKATELSYDDFLKYMTGLEEKKLVMETENGYELTEHGRAIYVKLKDVLPTLL